MWLVCVSASYSSNVNNNGDLSFGLYLTLISVITLDALKTPCNHSSDVIYESITPFDHLLHQAIQDFCRFVCVLWSYLTLHSTRNENIFFYCRYKKTHMHIVNKCHSRMDGPLHGLDHFRIYRFMYRGTSTNMYAHILWANFMLFTDLCVCTGPCAVFSVDYLKRVTTY